MSSAYLDIPPQLTPCLRVSVVGFPAVVK